jgi:hypothetical protein
LVETLQYASNWWELDKFGISGDGRRNITFSSTVELYADLFVHVLGQIQDVLLLGPFLLLLLRTATGTATSPSATAARAIITSAAVATTSPERASFGHGLAKSGYRK